MSTDYDSSWAAVMGDGSLVNPFGAQKYIRRSLAGAPDDQTYLRVPSIPSVAWQP